MARRYLAIPASSAPVERVFSTGQDILTKKRNRLKPSTFREIILLKNWEGIRDADDPDETDDEVETPLIE